MCLGNILIRDVLKLLRSTDEFLSDLVGKLDRRDEIAYTKTKAHREIDSLASLHHQMQIGWQREGASSHCTTRHVVCV